MGKQRISLVSHQRDRLATDKLLIISVVDGRGARHGQLIVLKTLGGLYHGGQVVFYLLLPAACQERNNRPVGFQSVPGTEVLIAFAVVFLKLRHLLHRGIAHVMDGVFMLILIERHLERQDGEHLPHVSLDGFHAPFFPSPYLGGDIVINGDAGMLLRVLRDTEVEAGIIHQYHHVGTPRRYVFLAHGHVAEDGGQMQKHRHEAHVGQLLIVLYPGAALGAHQVSTQETELRLGVFRLQGTHQVAGMQVATGLSYDDVILHDCSGYWWRK